MLREHGVVGKFVEFFGTGMNYDERCRPRDDCQYGSRVWRHDGLLSRRSAGTLKYLAETPVARQTECANWLNATARSRGCSARDDGPALELQQHAASWIWRRSNHHWLAPNDRRTAFTLRDMKTVFQRIVDRAGRQNGIRNGPGPSRDSIGHVANNGHSSEIGHGAVVIAAITSCTNTSNPSVMIGAGLLAKNADSSVASAFRHT